MVESDRQHLLAIERLILETICFNFTARMPFPYVIKFGKKLQGSLRTCIFFIHTHLFQASKKVIKLAWRISIDRYVVASY